MGIFVYAFTATGKSTLVKKYSNVIDMESTLYKYMESSNEDESLKSTVRVQNKEWPDNYFKALMEVKNKYDYILISDEICDNFLHENNFEYWWVYPKEELKKEYMKRCEKRGNNSEFIKWYSKLWKEWIEKCKADKLASKHIELKSGQYLEDVLPNLKRMEEKMKIGIDLDGVVIDSETTFRTYEEIFDVDKLKRNSLINREEPKFQSRYTWSDEEEKEFIKNYFMTVSKESPLMAGFVGVYKLLKEYDIEFVVITARGGFIKEMKDDAERLLNENNIKFDKYYWMQDDKLEICQKEKVDLMIDDDYKIIKKLSENGIKTLYFRDTGLKKLEENEYIKEVNNWGDIYRYIKSAFKIVRRGEKNGVQI